MHDLLSRKDRIEEQCIASAMQGNFGIITKVYKSEKERLEKQWHVEVIPIEEFENGMMDVAVTWRNFFNKNNRPTLEESFYISGWVEDRPEADCFARRLALDAMRASAASI